MISTCQFSTPHSHRSRFLAIVLVVPGRLPRCGFAPMAFLAVPGAFQGLLARFARTGQLPGRMARSQCYCWGVVPFPEVK